MLTQNKKVAIFTTFNSADPAYSLNRVVQDQIKMLVRNGYLVKVLVAEGFTPVEMYAHESVELFYIPNVPCHNEVKLDPTFDQDVDLIEQSLDQALKDVDVVITHDIVYQPAALKHNFASRRYAKKNQAVKWLHWIHSATSPMKLSLLLNIFSKEYTDLVITPFPNSYYVFFNKYSVPRIANNFNVPEEMVKVVHHPIDISGFLGVDEKVAELADKKKFYEADCIGIYPCRLDRGKQVEMLIKTMAMIKESGLSVRVVVIDFHSTGGDKINYRDDLKTTAIDWGLNPMEITFTSEVCPEWEIQVEHRVVRDFMLLSHLLVMSSVSESYSLVLQEAGLLGKICVANQDFPPFRDIFGSNLIYRKYSSGIDVMNGMDGWTETKYGPDAASPEERKAYEKMYHAETAKKIIYRLKNYETFALSNHITKHRNLDYVFRNELEPLFYS